MKADKGRKKEKIREDIYVSTWNRNRPGILITREIKFRRWKLTEREVSTQKKGYRFIQMPLCAHSLLSSSMSQKMRGEEMSIKVEKSAKMRGDD